MKAVFRTLISIPLFVCTPGAHATEITAHLVALHASHPTTQPSPAAVIWLQPTQPGLVHALAPGKFTLLQKNKTFTPHLLVVPVGSNVAFPNADPFFHNVFSLFDGRRFDLGLYEAGSTRSVTFSREGVSYIFCNIHSEMSAVVIALGTPYFAIADQPGEFHISGVTPGDYDLHVWVEGQRPDVLDQMTRRVRVRGPAIDLGGIHTGSVLGSSHLNKFGRPYEPDSRPIY